MNILPNALNHLLLRDPGLWESTGDEPQFGLSLPDEGLPAGWYALTIFMTADNDATLSPILYPDYGSGICERNRIPLSAWPGGVRNEPQIVRFDQMVQFLRFDPMAMPGRFRMETIDLKPIGRLQAVFLMVVALAGRGHGWRSSLGRAIAEMREGLVAFTAWLYSSYRFDGLQWGHDDYGRWLRLYERANDSAVDAERALAADGPLISIVVPIYHGSGRWLRRCIDSVRNQSYTNWELFLVHDATATRHVNNALNVDAKRDPRIKIIRSKRGSDLCAALDSALENAGGSHVALMRAEDELHRMALAQVALAVQARPWLQLVYCDEDEIDAHSQRFEPYFKPDWNYDLLLSRNYFGSFGIFTAQLLRSVGAFRRKGMEDQDHDRILRCIEEIDPAKEIHHIPRVLYHRRTSTDSIAAPDGVQSTELQDGGRSIREHLQRIGRSATVSLTRLGHYRIKYALPTRLPKVTIVIPTRDKVELLRRCVSSIFAKTQYPNYEIVVMDNQSVETETLIYFEEVQSDARIKVIRYDAPFNYSAINNKASELTDGVLLALINNDTEIISLDWLDEMVSHALRPEVGAVGAMLYYPDGTIQHAGVVLGSHGVGRHAHAGKPRGYRGQGDRAVLTQSLPAVTAACLVVRRQVFEEVAGFDERLQVAFNDIDFCLRLRKAGYTNVWTPYAELYHHESATRGHVDDAEGQQRLIGEVDLMMARWKDVILRDPAYNPNLSLSAEPYTLAFPPRSFEFCDCTAPD